MPLERRRLRIGHAALLKKRVHSKQYEKNLQDIGQNLFGNVLAVNVSVAHNSTRATNLKPRMDARRRALTQGLRQKRHSRLRVVERLERVRPNVRMLTR